MTISDHVQPVRALAVSRNDSNVLAGDDSGMVRVWLSTTGDRVAAFRAHTMSVRAIDESPDRGSLLTASVDGTVKIWRADRALQRILYLSSEYPVSSARFVTGNRVVAGIGGFDSTAVLLDTADSRPLIRYRGAGGAINAVDVAPARDRIVTASQDGSARVYELNSAAPLMTTGPYPSPMTAIAFDASGELLFCGHTDGTVRMVDAANGFELHSLRAHIGAVTGLRITHDGSLASSSLDSSVALWTVGAEALIPLRRYHEHSGAIGGVACGYGSPLLAAGALDATVVVYDASAPAATPGSTGDAALSLSARISSAGLVIRIAGERSSQAVVTVHDVLGRELARRAVTVNGAPLVLPLEHAGIFMVRATSNGRIASILSR